MDYKALSEQLVKSCLTKGADAAEVYLESRRNLRIEVRNGDLETVQEAASGGVGIRVFVQGRMAFASSNDLRSASLENAVARAVEFAKKTTADANNVLPGEKAIATVEGLYDPSIAQIPMEKKIAMARELEALGLKGAGVSKSDGSRYGESESEIFLANSNGLSKTYRASSCSVGVSLVAEKGEERSSGNESCSRRFFADLKPLPEIARKAIQSTTEMIGARTVKTQRAAVVFDPDVARSLLGGILGAINGETVLQGASFLGKQLDQKIASDLLTLVDDGTRPRGLGSRPFDGEGVPTSRRVIVDKGVLKGFLYNTTAAKRAGVTSTGNAVRNGFTTLPGIGPHNFQMLAGATRRDDIIKATERGLLLKGVTGYGINVVNGNFSGGAEGLWIENGQIAFPVKGLTIAGTAAQMFNAIDMVGDDLDPAESMGAPTFRIREMQIGGE